MSVCKRPDRAPVVIWNASKCKRTPRVPWRPTPDRQQSLRPGGAAVHLAQASSSVSEAAPASAFEQLYSQLAGVLAAPDSVVAAAATPFGRGLVVTQPVQKGATLLSGGRT